ncbi:MAG: phosphate starvation-inducible protein PhoH [Geminicoccus sp.]|nr:phosphate starvation-inducible protein PhoH [Geminicoccus sp.]
MTQDTSHAFRFADAKLALDVCGVGDANLALIEDRLSLDIANRSDEIILHGEAGSVELGFAVLESLYDRARRGLQVEPADVEAAIRLGQSPLGMEGADGDLFTENGKSKGAADQPGAAIIAITTRKKSISPRSPGQARYLLAMRDHELTFGVGPAGTGKTYLAAAMAISHLLEGKVRRLILSRPAVEAGERLGFLPGDMKEKVDPYLRPLYDALYDMLPRDQVAKRLEAGSIEIAPLAFMRGRTLSEAFVILDEAQNTTAAQMKMFLTRLGEGSRMVVNGDLSQVDLPRGVKSGLRDALDTLRDVKGIAINRFDSEDVVRHPLVGRIVKAYDSRPAPEAEAYKTDADRS